MSPIFPYRSPLYVPATNLRAMRKTRELPADFTILDLEDSVAPEAKADARATLAQAFAEGVFADRRIVIRVNGLTTPFGHEDLALCASLGPHGVLLPKVESADGVTQAGALLAQAGAPHDVALWAMIETPRGILNVAQIAQAGGRLQCLVAGTNDLAVALRLPPGDRRSGLACALSWLVLAARAEGLAVLDGVFNDLDDARGFLAECEAGRLLGFDGKTLIHPRQIETANAIFAPSAQTVAQARAIVEAFAAAGSQTGVVKVNGQMAERLHLEEARRLLALAQATGH